MVTTFFYEKIVTKSFIKALIAASAMVVLSAHAQTTTTACQDALKGKNEVGISLSEEILIRSYAYKEMPATLQADTTLHDIDMPMPLASVVALH